MEKKHLHWINGNHQASMSGKENQKINPFDGKSMGDVAQADVMDVVAALPGAKKAILEFEKISLKERARRFRLWSETLDQNKKQWSSLEAWQLGLPQSFLEREIFSPSVNFLNQLASELDEAEAEKNQISSTLRRPTGVLGLSISSDLPGAAALERLAPALAAGNSVILHFSSLTPVTADWIRHLVEIFDGPSGLVQILLGNRQEVATFLASHPGLSGFSGNGSEKHRQSLIQAANSSGKKIQLRFRGKNSLIFLKDPESTEDLRQKLISCWLGKGESAISSHRIFILDSFRESFLEKLKEVLATMKLASSPESLETSIWPTLRPPQLFEFEKFQQAVPQESGRIFSAGKIISNPGHWSEPLWTLDLSNCSVWQQEDLHRPLFLISSVKYPFDVAKWTNTGTFGHSAVIYGDEDKAKSLAQKLQVGQVWINKWKYTWAHEFEPQKLSAAGDRNFSWRASFFSDSTNWA